MKELKERKLSFIRHKKKTAHIITISVLYAASKFELTSEILVLANIVVKEEK